jgi:hypothetical protein
MCENLAVLTEHLIEWTTTAFMIFQISINPLINLGNWELVRELVENLLNIAVAAPATNGVATRTSFPRQRDIFGLTFGATEVEKQTIVSH